MPKAYSYIRFSRPEQLRGDSLRRQIEKAEQWATENGLTIDESIKDLGVSGFRGANRITGALGRFLELVKRGKVEPGSVLIVESLDRISREAVRFVQPSFLALINAGIRIVTLTDGQEYYAERLDREPMAIFGAVMVMIRANEESSIKSDRVGEAWKKKRASGQVMSARIPAWLKVIAVDGKQRIVERNEPDDDRVAVIRRIFTETIAGYGRRRVAERLDAVCKPFAGGKRWQPSYVKKVLENRAVLGEYQPTRLDAEGKRIPAGDPRPDYFPQVVDETTFLRAQSAKAGRAAAPGQRGEGVTNLIQGITWCTECNGRMVRENKGSSSKSGPPRFVCSEARAKSCTNDRKWPLAEVERTILGRVTGIDIDAVLAEEPVERGPTISDLEAQVADRKRRRETLLDLVEAGDPDAGARALRFLEEIRDAEAEIAVMRSRRSLSAAQPSSKQRMASFEKLRARLADATGQERDDLRTRLSQELRSLLKAVRFSDWHVEVVFHKHLTPKGLNHREVVVTVFCDHPDYLRNQAEDAEPEPETFARQTEAIHRWLSHRASVREIVGP